MNKCLKCGDSYQSKLTHERLCKSKQDPPKRLEFIGFSNGWGESNCFLNSALQVL